MEIIEWSSSEKKEKKIYTMWQVSVATLLTGPLTGMYLMSRNFAILGQKEYAQKTIIIAIVSTLLLSSFLLLLPDRIVDGIPGPLIGIVCRILINVAMRKYQHYMIDIYLENWWKKHSWWRVFGIGILSIIVEISFAIVLSVIFSIIENMLQ